MNPVPPQLDYAPPPSRLRRRRLRRWLVLVSLILATSSSWWWGGPLAQHVKVSYWLWQCETYTAPADHVMYDSDPAHADALRRAGCVPERLRGETVVLRRVACWDQLYPFIERERGIMERGAVLFVHARRSGSTEPRLVVVEYFGRAHHGEPVFHCWTRPSRAQGGGPVESFGDWDFWKGFGGGPEGGRGIRDLRLYAGQPDSNDPSRFSITLEADGRPGTIRGRLQDDGKVELRFRYHRVDEPN